MTRAEYLINHYGMEMLTDEGTWIRQIYRAPDMGVTATFGIYTADPPSLSRFHCLSVNELWSWYEGDPIELFLLPPLSDSSAAHRIVLGPDTSSGETYQFIVPAGTWMGSRLVSGGSYALYGCTCVPGFTDDCYTHGDRDTLTATYPEMADIINQLT